MPSTVTRRPLPALIALLALLVLTGLVWWRVLARSDPHPSPQAKPCPTPTRTVVLPSPSTVTIQVLNATTRTGIAGKARTALTSAGFSSPTVAGNDQKNLNKIKGVAQIRYGATSKSGAQLLAYYVPGAQLVPVTTSSKTVVVSLGNKYSSIASSSQVTAALRKAGAATSAPTPAATCAR